MSDLTTKLSLIALLGVACFGLGWFAHAPAPPSTVTRIVQAQAAHAETVYVRDTLRFTQWRTQYDTTRDTVLRHLTDTVRVARFIRVADSTVIACQTALGSCTRALDAQKVVVQVQQAQQPSKMRQFLTIAVAAGAGYSLSRLTHH